MTNLIFRYYIRSDNPRFKHVAIVRRGRRVIGIGWNTGWNHAERDAIRGIRNQELLKGSTLYSYRVSNSMHLRNAKPCPRCEALIRSVGISKVVYSGPNGEEKEYAIEAA